MQEDIEPYRQLAIDGVMAAHVIYNCMDCNTAVFSNKWIDFLRNDIEFNGVVFTDDLSMAGAGVVGDMLARVQTAYAAGCDMLLVCNAPDVVGEVLAQWKPQIDVQRGRRVEALLPRNRAKSWMSCKPIPTIARLCKPLTNCRPENEIGQPRLPNSSLTKTAYYLTRFLYSSVRVSISILSPILTKAGTGNSKPLASLAGFITFPDVSPLTAGSV